MIESQARGIDQFGDEGLHGMVRSDLVERNGNLLPALAAERDVNIALGIDGGIPHRMQVVGDLHAQRNRKRRALHAAHANANRAAQGSIGNTGDQHVLGGHYQTAFHRTELHLGPRVVSDGKAVTTNSQLAARKSRCGFHAFDPRRAVCFRDQLNFPWVYSSTRCRWESPAKSGGGSYNPAARAIHNPIAA